jgi:cysteine/O-acetylserine efflux protein
MLIPWLPLASYVFVTTFTPGPNNISAMSLGISHGYRRSLQFLAGITLGFFVVMVLCAVVDTLLLGSLPSIEPYLRIFASLYIVWLSIHTFVSSLKADSTSTPPLHFHDGLLLQLLNPKVIVYGLSLYSSFLTGIAGDLALIALSAVVLTTVGFIAISTWAIAGTSFSRMFKKPLIRTIVSAGLSLLLLYSAVESSGLLTILLSR